jgi:hypothetical protein
MSVFPRALLALTIVQLMACPGPTVAPKKTTPDKPKLARAYLLLVNTQVTQADVMIDGKRVADLKQATAAPGIALSPGVHRLEVRAAGFSPFRLELKLVVGQTERLKVELQAKRKPAGGV